MSSKKITIDFDKPTDGRSVKRIRRVLRGSRPMGSAVSKKEEEAYDRLERAVKKLREQGGDIKITGDGTR